MVSEPQLPILKALTDMETASGYNNKLGSGNFPVINVWSASYFLYCFWVFPWVLMVWKKDACCFHSSVVNDRFVLA